MSYINVYRTTTGSSRLEVNLPSLQKGDEDHSFTDGEDLVAVAKILELVDELDNGEALVIIREIF
ncbi:hypothetical protein [Streptomyces sparsogenes]|uniref:hypothetical protein n=1 Tax=Streptomyces sparsogenes TaxID=67365 RepID=UPI0033CBB897